MCFGPQERRGRCFGVGEDKEDGGGRIYLTFILCFVHFSEHLTYLKTHMLYWSLAYVQVARLVGGPTVEELCKRIEDLQRLH
jgi:hypothetical protein